MLSKIFFVLSFLFVLVGMFPVLTGSELSSELTIKGDFKTLKEKGFDIQKGLDFDATKDSFRGITIRVTYRNKILNFKDTSAFVHFDYSGVFFRELIIRSIFSVMFVLSTLVGSDIFANYANAKKRFVFLVSCIFCSISALYLLLERSIFTPIFYKNTRDFFAPLEVNPPSYFYLILFFFLIIYFVFVFEKTKEARLPVNKRSP
jgi:hypothetical protein